MPYQDTTDDDGITIKLERRQAFQLGMLLAGSAFQEHKKQILRNIAFNHIPGIQARMRKDIQELESMKQTVMNAIDGEDLGGTPR